ncbi:MAG: diaminopimelate decarboxylase [Rhodospirillales bacterium]|jgi:diaminopimelate decarboxylase|nr:diaminopimelate decarboxylase [Rhodospirillales bacterium]HIJ43410.1 diaminopimelate decarboxylase [Rhodospirillaceae bacterium]HIJ44576.1 diaminopimelate decarboxylase [Rhodospirillaceae bacterium]HIJ93157.1 diaminopimelate decarboxylase [Rhodospirillaceae bacterium]
MDHFVYRDGRLCAEDVSLIRIAEETGTPFYCYSQATIERHYRVFADAFADVDATVCYAVKANSNIAVIGVLARLGAGADVVSGGELKRALTAGIPASRIVFSGIGKTGEELAAALDAGILQINVESEPELELLGQVAADKGVSAPVAIRINPGIDALTHDKIATGKAENKFGIEWTRAHRVYCRAMTMPGIDIVGIAVHIGSQVTDLEPFREAYVRTRDLAALLRADGIAIRRLDLGGGLGIPYGDEPAPSPGEYAAVVKSAIGDLDCHLILEPGRVIAGNAGILVTSVLYVKEGATRRFVVVDAAMNDLMRPALYNAFHGIATVMETPAKTECKEVDVVGPICETGDTFATGRPLPPLKAGDLLAIRAAGAYGAVMSSVYNTRPLVPEVLVRGGDFALVRERLSVDDMLSREVIPNWLKT